MIPVVERRVWNAGCQRHRPAHNPVRCTVLMKSAVAIEGRGSAQAGAVTGSLVEEQNVRPTVDSDGAAASRIVVRLARASERPLLEGLFQFYAYDFSEMKPSGSVAFEVDAAGRFAPYPHMGEYWSVADRWPLLIELHAQAVGFVFVNTLSTGWQRRAQHGGVLRRAKTPTPWCRRGSGARSSPLSGSVGGRRSQRTRPPRPSRQRQSRLRPMSPMSAW